MGRYIHRSSAILIKNCHMIVRYMITCFGTTFETLTEIESLQGPTTLNGGLRRHTNICILHTKQSSFVYICLIYKILFPIIITRNDVIVITHKRTYL
jgi:hypothetical protein